MSCMSYDMHLIVVQDKVPLCGFQCRFNRTFVGMAADFFCEIMRLSVSGSIGISPCSPRTRSPSILCGVVCQIAISAFRPFSNQAVALPATVRTIFAR